MCSPKFRYLPSLGMRNAYSSAEKRPNSRKECFLKLSKYSRIVGWDNYYIFKKKKKKKKKKTKRKILLTRGGQNDISD